MIEQYVDQFGEAVPTPGPVTFHGETFFVDVENDDTFVDPSGHVKQQTLVVSNILQLGEQRDFHHPGGWH